MIQSPNTLTTEFVRKLFNNNFRLTNYAIALARFYVGQGQEVNATNLIKEVSKHPDEAYLDVLKELEDEKDVDEETPES